MITNKHKVNLSRKIHVFLSNQIFQIKSLTIRSGVPSLRMELRPPLLHIFFINGSENLTQMVPDSLNEGMVYKQMVY